MLRAILIILSFSIFISLQVQAKPIARILFNDSNNASRFYQVKYPDPNPEGVITRENLLNVIQKVDPFLFSQVYSQTQPLTQTDSSLYQSRMESVATLGLGLLVLNRIIDHEAVKQNYSFELHSARLYYAVRLVMLQTFAMSPEFVTLDRQKILQFKNNELFKFLKTRELFEQNAADKNNRKHLSFTYRIEWDGWGGLMFEEKKSIDNAVIFGADTSYWQTVELRFDCQRTESAAWTKCFPETVVDLENKIRTQLQETYLETIRKAVWEKLITQLYSPYMRYSSAQEQAVQYSELAQRLLLENPIFFETYTRKSDSEYFWDEVWPSFKMTPSSFPQKALRVVFPQTPIGPTLYFFMQVFTLENKF